MVDQFTLSIFCDFSGLANVTSILKDLLLTGVLFSRLAGPASTGPRECTSPWNQYGHLICMRWGIQVHG